MKTLLNLLTLILAAVPASADGPDPVRTAVVKGLRRIEQGSANYLKNRKCFSCHHQAVTIHCLVSASKRGLEVDPAKLRQQVDFTLNTFRHKREQVALGKAVPGGNTMAAYALFGLEAAGHAAGRNHRCPGRILARQAEAGRFLARRDAAATERRQLLHQRGPGPASPACFWPSEGCH